MMPVVWRLCSTTFYFWCRSLRGEDEGAWKWGVATGLAYTYMVAAWGGFIFVLNMIAIHAGILVILGRSVHHTRTPGPSGDDEDGAAMATHRPRVAS